MFYCPNCGGKMVFDIPTQQMKCVYCGSQVPPENYDIKNEVDPSKYETNVYVCKNCGAELTSPDEQMVSFCSYCGSEAVLAGKIESENRPKEIIPFRITKKRCQELYKQKVGKALFLPKEMKDEQFLDQFRGIYIPYWSVGVEFPQFAQQMAYSETHLSGSKYQHDTYLLNLRADSRGRYMRDGSSSLDDSIADAIGDFSENVTPFKAAYLAGFYADRADVMPDKYVADVQKEAKDHAAKAISSEFSRRNMHYTTPSLNSMQLRRAGINPDQIHTTTLEETFQPVCKDYYGKLLPVWFLTWRNKDRVSYVVMNGETGSMYTELPVKKSSYLTFAGILALIIFALMSLFLTVLPTTTLGITAILALISLTVLTSELKKLMEKELHLNDIGSKEYDAANESLKKKTKSKYKAAKGAGVGCGTTVLMIAAYVGIRFLFDMIGGGGGVGDQYTFLTISGFATGILGIIQMIRAISKASHLKEKSMVIWPILNGLAILIAFFIAMWRPVNDWWYYGGAVVCMIATLLPALKLIDVYNLMATRPLPSFFGREGANHALKD
ncbi:MAG: zinc ribbon domain-containing protein [Firmicutes bacterium]|nr:zinc ribbon domain-containing protein [Bacillota bacterium]